MSDIAGILERAADLIEPEGAWTQGWFARDANGAVCNLDAADAVCWCAAGAVYRVGGCNDAFSPFGDIFDRKSLLSCALQTWNDDPERTQSEVVAKLREAAAKARSQVPA